MRGRRSKETEINRDLLELEADLENMEVDVFEEEDDDTEELSLGGNWGALEDYEDE